VQAQIQSHMGQPATKYSRLKQYIVNQYLMGEPARRALQEDFELIFSRLLPGKALHDLTINTVGTLSVRIKEASSGAIYDIDSMSSGEKGLLLTFLLLRRSIGTGGIVLIDEPELHLNPTVTRKVLPFLIEDILKPAGIQAILCTHSPEILERQTV
jgi:predicted ATP-dependent endonuclease of OLD family